MLPALPSAICLKLRIADIAAKKVEIPLIIGGEEVRTGKTGKVVMPHDHQHVLGEYHIAGEKEINMAIEAAMAAKADWAALRWEERAAIFLKAAELLAGRYRYLMNAISMLSTSKSAYQAEIDAACELIDFLRFNVYYAQQVYTDQPLYSPTGCLELRPAPSAGRFRLCRCAFQLHCDRRQPRDFTGDHGQHGPAQAGIVRAFTPRTCS